MSPVDMWTVIENAAIQGLVKTAIDKGLKAWEGWRTRRARKKGRSNRRLRVFKLFAPQTSSGDT
jgi:hypothetical protein